MGKDIRPDGRETNPGNGATAGISGELVTPGGMGDLVVTNTGFKDCDNVKLPVAGKSMPLKIGLNRK
jgi:hypothetical protein